MLLSWCFAGVQKALCCWGLVALEACCVEGEPFTGLVSEMKNLT